MPGQQTVRVEPDELAVVGRGLAQFHSACLQGCPIVPGAIIIGTGCQNVTVLPDGLVDATGVGQNDSQIESYLGIVLMREEGL